MEQWLEDLLSVINERLAAQQLDPAEVHWSTKRRMAYDIRWPVGRQMEAHFDNSLGNPAKLDLMQAEFAAIKEAIPKETVAA